ncbi:conserved hypothetical protein [Trichinella spiralis]|uniref:hypothetical protein n=1 Tax=Trichinella spiralis TaxID=6334 RepID=UPI0001EFD3CB|nr:conserved hypothetical protein [Trichinella spiralis]
MSHVTCRKTALSGTGLSGILLYIVLLRIRKLFFISANNTVPVKVIFGEKHFSRKVQNFVDYRLGCFAKKMAKNVFSKCLFFHCWTK